MRRVSRSAHEIADQAALAIGAVLPRADVVVHAEPLAPGRRGTDDDGPRAGGPPRHGRPRHPHLRRQGHAGIEFHLEVNGLLRLEEAHRLATEFERGLARPCPACRGSSPTSSRWATRRPRSGRNRPPRRRSAPRWRISTASTASRWIRTTSSPSGWAASCKSPFTAALGRPRP